MSDVEFERTQAPGAEAPGRLPPSWERLAVESRGGAIIATLKFGALRSDSHCRETKEEMGALGALRRPVILDLGQHKAPSEELTSVVLKLLGTANAKVMLIGMTPSVRADFEKKGIPKHPQAVMGENRSAALQALGIDSNTPGTPL